MEIDRQSFLQLIEGDKEIFVSLLDLFKAEWPEAMTRLELAIAQNDAKQVELWAHRLKGNLRNFYAHEASALAERLETAGHSGQLVGIDGVLDVLRGHCEKVEEELSTLLRSL